MRALRAYQTQTIRLATVVQPVLRAALARIRHSLYDARMQTSTPRSSNEHRMILAAMVLSLGGAVALGGGRFAYALLLEPMRNGLQWSYAEAGLINSANSVGYFLGTTLVGISAARLGPGVTLRLGMTIASLSMLVTGLLSDYTLLLVMRTLTGIGGGLIYVGGATVLLQRSGPTGNPPLSVYYSGPGLGIALSGIIVPTALGLLAGDGWRTIWIGIGLFGLTAMLLMEPHLRGTTPTHRHAADGRRSIWRGYGRIWPMLLAFLIYGIGYIGYMTFVIAFLQSLGAAPGVIQWFWIVLGLCAATGNLAWSIAFRRIGPQRSAGLILLTMALAAALPVFAAQIWVFMLSGILFGGSFLAMVVAVTSQIRNCLESEQWAGATGHAVAFFAAGQLIGPALTGIVADMQGGLALGMLLSFGMLVVAALVSQIPGTPHSLR
jgi:predicted MFS family arabinose efflux permease